MNVKTWNMDTSHCKRNTVRHYSQMAQTPFLSYTLKHTHLSFQTHTHTHKHTNTHTHRQTNTQHTHTTTPTHTPPHTPPHTHTRTRAYLLHDYKAPRFVHTAAGNIFC